MKNHSKRIVTLSHKMSYATSYCFKARWENKKIKGIHQKKITMFTTEWPPLPFFFLIENIIPKLKSMLLFFCTFTFHNFICSASSSDQHSVHNEADERFILWEMATMSHKTGTKSDICNKRFLLKEYKIIHFFVVNGQEGERWSLSSEWT